jgi:V/A-type H+-transporting ATPase subunit F
MYKVGVIGDKDSILGFKILGLSVFPVTTPEEAAKIINKMAKEEYAVIYITENIAEKVRETINEYKSSRFPAVIPIPGNEGPLGIGMEGIKNSMIKAVGTDILV